ncbi:MAG: protein PhnA [Planctomycetota bacterium]|jgi:protein PhnA
MAPREDAIAACGTCRGEIEAELGDLHRWHCLQETAWSEHPAVQVASWRLLGRIGESWATDLRDQLYLDEDTAEWARAGHKSSQKSSQGSGAPSRPTVDSNGAALAAGDSVTLIKDLDVKGAGFTAKRGTLVKDIRLADDHELIEGRVNKTVIYLRTEFLKKA